METERKIAVSLSPVSPSVPTNVSNNVFPPVRPMHGRTSGPTRRSTRGQWTPEEDEILRRAVHHYQGKNWKKIAECFKDRTDVQCLHRWQKVLNPELIKGPWSKEEDETIVQLVNKYGPKKWSTIAQHLPGRIGKQCRERWHNHLNPAINREPWTQEEELVLIRAHQIHGNKWAELTKYLPGRTDNAIKNHWNSSVKKKLDSLLASGLLAQFQGLPLISHQNESNPGASLREHCSNGDGSVSKGGADAEDNSESTQVGVSQTVSEISNTACQTGEVLLMSEESNHGKVQVTSAMGSYSGQYYMSLDDVTFNIPNIPSEFSCPPKYLDTNFSKDSETCVNGYCNFDLIALQNMALELAVNSTNLSGFYELSETQNDGVHGLSHLSTEYDASTFVNNMALESEFSAHELEPNAEGCSLTLSQEGCVRYPSSVNLTNSADIIDMDRYSDPLGFQSSFQVSEVGGTVTLQPCNPLNAAMGEDSQCQCLPSADDPTNDDLTTSQAHEVAKAVLAEAQDYSASPSNVHIDVSLSEQMDLMDSSKLVPVDTNGSETLDSQEEAGTLCYEPPRFPPTLNIPFFSCDLAQSCADGQQDFSPLGIRQLMMSSMNCLTPFKLWDSPSSDDSPDELLKSSAKTCSCTPSILKKRRRDLLSPLSPFSERRYGRKVRSDINQGFLCTSKLTKEFSRLDVIVNDANPDKELPSASDDQNDTTEVSIKEKNVICLASLKEAKKANCNNTEDEPSEVDGENNEEKEDSFDHQSTLKSYEHCASETPRGILVECHSNSTNFSSPSETRLKAVWKSSEGTTEVHQNSIHAVEPNKDAVPSSQSASAVSSLMVDSLLNEVGAENLNIFGGTPFRRSIESPSAWKSPWYFSSLVPCSRFDTDVMLEDIGIFMSPGERSVDALSLMKQINEQNADAYADAKKVLGSDTPDSILRQRCFRNQDAERKTEKGTDSRSEGRLRLASNILTERRTLDFSECGTPAKSVEKGKCRNAASLSSPSCLLKNYR